jgi:hypothetical protein
MLREPPKRSDVAGVSSDRLIRFEAMFTIALRKNDASPPAVQLR